MSTGLELNRTRLGKHGLLQLEKNSEPRRQNGTSSCKTSIQILTDVNLVLLRIWSLILSCIGKGVTGLVIDFAAFQKFLGSEPEPEIRLI